MAETYTRLGSAAATASSTVGVALVTYSTGPIVISTVTISNTAATSATYYLYVVSSAESLTYATVGAKGAIVHGATIAANDTVCLTLGLVLDATNNRLICSASATTVGFNAFGVTIT